MPALVGAGLKPALIQTRGRSFLEFMQTLSQGKYPIDTVLSTGEIRQDDVPCWGAFSLGQEDDKKALMQEVLPQMKGYVLY